MSATAGSARATLVAEGRLPWRRRRMLVRALPASSPLPGRYRYVHDVAGPKVRVGVAWFVLVLASCAPGPPPWGLATVLAPVAGVAAAQTGRAHLQTRSPRGRSSRSLLPLVAGVAAAGVAGAAAAGPQPLGGAILLAVAGTIAAAGTGLIDISESRARKPAVDAGGEPARPGPAGTSESVAVAVRCWLFVALAVAAPLLLARVEIGRSIVLLFLVAAYDVGDYLVGSASSNAVEGPLAGVIGVVVMTFAAAVVDAPGFEGGWVWVFGLLAAVLCPLGPLVASAILPRAGAFAPALRRLDSWLLVGPVWVLGFH
jgi:hypothetical protein